MKLRILITEDTESTVSTSLEGPDCQCGHGPDYHMNTVELELEQGKELSMGYVLYHCLHPKCSCFKYAERLS